MALALALWNNRTVLTIGLLLLKRKQNLCPVTSMSVTVKCLTEFPLHSTQ